MVVHPKGTGVPGRHNRQGQGAWSEVVAEGVETDAIWDEMRELGADEVQGFLAARPLARGGGADLVGCMDAAGQALRLRLCPAGAEGTATGGSGL